MTFVVVQTLPWAAMCFASKLMHYFRFRCNRELNAQTFRASNGGLTIVTIFAAVCIQ